MAIINIKHGMYKEKRFNKLVIKDNIMVILNDK